MLFIYGAIMIFYFEVFGSDDNIPRYGIVIKLMTEQEVRALEGDVIQISGKSYNRVEAATGREVDFDSGNYFIILTGYCEQKRPSSCIDVMVILNLQGPEIGRFVAGGIILKLVHDNDIKHGIIEHETPPSLEFVMINKQCGFMGAGGTVRTVKYGTCSNYQSYITEQPKQASQPFNLGKNLNLYYRKRAEQKKY